MPRKSKLKPFHDLVGTVPDREIAAMAGCSIATVCHYRQRYDIPSYRSRLGEGAATSTLVTPTAHPSEAIGEAADTGLHGYTVTLRTRRGTWEAVVMAPGVVEAAKIAARHGTVVRIAYVGSALV